MAARLTTNGHEFTPIVELENRSSFVSISVHSWLKFLLAISVACLASCETSNRLLKAKPAPLSDFVEHSKDMKPHKERVPFQYAWFTPDKAVQKRAAEKTEIYITPVSLKFLRPISQKLAKDECADGGMCRREDEIAKELQLDFQRAFSKSPYPAYTGVLKPTKHSLTLELALVELTPTCTKGNGILTAAGFLVGPVGLIGGHFTKGNIAVEGKLTNSTTHELVFEFADNEADLMTLYSVRDFKAYGHAEHAMEDWAKEFEEFTRTTDDHKVKGTNFFTLSLW